MYVLLMIHPQGEYVNLVVTIHKLGLMNLIAFTKWVGQEQLTDKANIHYLFFLFDEDGGVFI